MDTALLLVRLRATQPDGSTIGATRRTCHLDEWQAAGVQQWMSIGDEDDLEHLREAVTDAQ